MKTYTDIEQSKELAEILSVECADMWYPQYRNNITGELEYNNVPGLIKTHEGTPCWSLAALLDVIPTAAFKSLICYEKDDIREWFCEYQNNKFRESTKSDNPIDTCVEMILKLKEKNIL